MKGVIIMSEKTLSQYKIIFDERSYGWSNVKKYNLIFLKHQESFFNELLRKKGISISKRYIRRIRYTYNKRKLHCWMDL